MSADLYINFMEPSARNIEAHSGLYRNYSLRQHVYFPFSTSGRHRKRHLSLDEVYAKKAKFLSKGTRVHLGALSGLRSNGVGSHLQAIFALFDTAPQGLFVMDTSVTEALVTAFDVANTSSFPKKSYDFATLAELRTLLNSKRDQLAFLTVE